jgi:hypothetical protein
MSGHLEGVKAAFVGRERNEKRILCYFQIAVGLAGIRAAPMRSVVVFLAAVQAHVFFY